MALVEEYYELNEAEEVSAIWKFLHITFYMCAACLGLWCAFTLAEIRTKMGDKCFLFTSIKSNTEKVLISHIDWETDFWCDYCQFTMVFSFIVATIWATFFLMCGRGGKSVTRLPQPWRIVFCSLIFNLIYFSVALSASIQIHNGTEYFCEFHKHKSSRMRSWLHHCSVLDIIFANDKKKIEMTILQLEIVVKTSWFCTGVWLLLILLSFFRIIFVVDFRMYKICVFQIDDTTHNRKEEVLKITTYEDPKKLQQTPSTDVMGQPFGEENSDELEKRKDNPETGNTLNKYRSARSPLQSNAAFYVTADIRMLNREKKRNKMKALDQAFEKNYVSRGKKKFMQLALDEPGVSHPSRFSYPYSNLVFKQLRNRNDDEEDDGESSEDPSTQSKNTARRDDGSWASGSDDSALENQSVTLKKKV